MPFSAKWPDRIQKGRTTGTGNASMENHIDVLIDILTRETALYQKMAGILREERAVTIASSLDGLHAVRGEKEQTIAAIADLERQRLGLARTINREWFGATGPVAVSDLVSRLDPPAAQRLSRCRETLVDTLNHVSDMNARNASLLAHSMKWVGGAMRLLEHLFNPQAVYQRTGKFAGGGRTGRVLNGTY